MRRNEERDLASRWTGPARLLSEGWGRTAGAMFTLRCTSKLLGTLKVEPVAATETTTRLGNWYANHLAGPRSPIICVSERTFLPVVVERCGAAELPGALAEALAGLLTALGIPKELVEQERRAMAQWSFAKTESRSVLGVMNDHARLACLLLDRALPLAELSRELAENIVKLQFPIELTQKAFGLGERGLEGAQAQSESVEQLVRDFAQRAPVDAHVVGVPVQVVEVCEEGNDRRGLVAVCERRGERHRVSLADVVFDERSPESRLSSAYRRLLGLDALQRSAGALPHKATAVPLGEPLELVVLAAKSSALRCRVLGSRRELTLRAAVRDAVPGEIISVRPSKQWTHAGHPYVSGEVTGSRLDVARLELVPLALRPEGEWDPEEEYWGEGEEDLPAWATEIIARGPRPQFEMEQVLPGVDPDDWESDPIVESNELKAAGQRREADALLQGLLAQDLRCLDAHAHLGNMVFDFDVRLALRHYRVGVAIGDQTLGAEFNGVLPWGLIDNRPYLRCLEGLGFCLWRLGTKAEAERVFSRLLWLNPGDHQGARFNLHELQQGRDWRPE